MFGFCIQAYWLLTALYESYYPSEKTLNWDTYKASLSTEDQQIITSTFLKSNESLNEVSFFEIDAEHTYSPAYVNTLSKKFGLNTSYFSFSPEERQFILGHEVGHLRTNDSLRSLVATLLIPCATYIGFPILHTLIKKVCSYGMQGHKKDTWQAKLCNIVHKVNGSLQQLVTRNPLFLAVINSALYASYAQRLEYRADAHGALCSRPQDGIAMFQHIDTIIESTSPETAPNEADSTRLAMRLLSSLLDIQYWFYHFFGSHPSHENRIQALESLTA